MARTQAQAVLATLKGASDFSAAAKGAGLTIRTADDLARVVLAEDGDVVDLYHGKAAIVGSVPCGYIYVDGDSVGELTDEELEKRRILGSEGFVSCFAVVDTDDALLVMPRERAQDVRLVIEELKAKGKKSLL